MIRVAFPVIGGRGWTGGYNYLLNLLRVVQTYAPGRISPVVLFGTDSTATDRAPFEAIPGVQIVVDRVFGSAGKSRRLLQALFLGLDTEAAKLFYEHRIEVVFENAQFYGWRLPIAAIAWMPDFQHRHLKHFFSFFARAKRTLGFDAQVFSGRIIMLSSEDARTDCEHFHPASRGRTAVAHFAIALDHTIDAIEARAAASRHGLPETYFFLPNQFWRHKNHDLVIQALAILKSRGKSVLVAASGNTVDLRAPGHFDRVLERAEALGVTELFRPLGLIPYAEVTLLMRASAAVINPSTFEGWSTTVEEAKATGTPMILSDLPVHREQAGSDAILFDPHSPEDLALKLEAFVPYSPAERAGAADEAVVKAGQRVEIFARTFADLIERAALSVPGKARGLSRA